MHADEGGAVLVETALGVALILTIALPFAALVGYGATSARDLSSAHAAAREAARSQVPGGATVTYTCGSTASTADGPCGPSLARGTYVAASLDTAVALPFGLVLHTNARAVARVG